MRAKIQKAAVKKRRRTISPRPVREKRKERKPPPYAGAGKKKPELT